MANGNPAEMKIAAYFEANASEDLKARVKASGKTAKGAVEYACREAKKMKSSGGCVCVDDDTVFGWCMHYFEDVDDKSCETETSAKVATSADVADPYSNKTDKKQSDKTKKAKAKKQACEQTFFDLEGDDTDDSESPEATDATEATESTEAEEPESKDHEAEDEPNGAASAEG